MVQELRRCISEEPQLRMRSDVSLRAFSAVGIAQQLVVLQEKCLADSRPGRPGPEISQGQFRSFSMPHLRKRRKTWQRYSGTQVPYSEGAVGVSKHPEHSCRDLQREIWVRQCNNDPFVLRAATLV